MSVANSEAFGFGTVITVCCGAVLGLPSLLKPLGFLRHECRVELASSMAVWKRECRVRCELEEEDGNSVVFWCPYPPNRVCPLLLCCMYSFDIEKRPGGHGGVGGTER